MRHSQMKRLLSFMMAVVMLLSLSVNGVYAVEPGSAGLTVERLDPSEVTADLVQPGLTVAEKNNFGYTYAETDRVRVIIVLERDPAISLFSVGNDADVARYREELEELQEMVAEYISEEALDGESMEVVGNLTLVSNAISAVVEYGQIDAIRNVDGVASVFVEPVFHPLEAVPNNAAAQQMTGSGDVQKYYGYTGAGSRIAVIDTGTDTDHQSLAVAGYEYALAELAAAKGMSYDAYVETLGLLDKEEILSVLTQLNAYKNYEGTLTADDLYISTKQPFAFNYVDRDLDVTNDVDNILSHGSHVAGIAAANRYIECGTVYDFDGNGSFDEDDIQSVMEFIVSGTELAGYELADVSGNGTVSSYDVYLLNRALAGHQNGGYYVDAAKTVLVSGSAPDAQLITMKVFGKNGGAYALDYMQAVEDAILLNCDVVNLSLGTSSAGFTEPHYDDDSQTGWNSFINKVMSEVADTDVVLSVSGGNSYSWSYFDLWNPNDDQGEGMLYTDEGGVSSVAEPASYENSLAVASVDNIRTMGTHEMIVSGANDAEGMKLVPSDSYYTQDVPEDQIPQPWYSMDEVDASNEGTEYEIVFLGDPTALLTGGEQTDTSIYAGKASDFEGYDFTGKVVLVARGGMLDVEEDESDEGENGNGEDESESEKVDTGIYFIDKYKNAALAGAAAVLIYNNVDGQIVADLTNPDTNVPVGTITLAEAQEIYSMFTKNAAGLYSGKFTVYNYRTISTNNELTMSIFSSWGPTGDLSMKPEITAPGGAIYSINGNDPSNTAYELMSGTSMAAPHLAGLTAQLNQYFDENDLLSKTNMSARHLAHSLLMSTASPIIEAATGLEYSVRTQGAGLADVKKAVESNAYITVAGQTDGKVKAELGDGDEARTITFTIHNFGDTVLTYDLSASVLTTATEVVDGNYYSSDSMAVLPADVAFSQSSVTVAAGGSATVTATISLPDATVADMNAKGYTNGFYLEGFLYITSTNGDVSHSIPMLGWYGDWSDPSMYDKGSFMDYVDDATAKPGHVYAPYKNMMSWLPAGYTEALPYTGNLYGGMTQDKVTGDVYMVGDQRYLEGRNAISSDPDHWWELYGVVPTLIRNAGDVHFTIKDANSGELYFEEDFEDMESDTLISSYFSTSSGTWWNSADYYVVGPDEWRGTDAEGNPLEEDTEVIITLSAAPEYYLQEINGQTTVDWDSLGDGTDLSFRFRVDNTEPELVDISYVNGKLNYTVKDNNHIAAVILMDGAASKTYENFYPDMDVDDRGEAVEGSFDLSQYTSRKVAIAVCDYAGNESYFALNLNGTGAGYGELVGFQYDAGTWYSTPDLPTWTGIDLDVADGKEFVKNESALFRSTTEFACAEYVNGHVYAQSKDGKFYGIPYEDMLADTVDLEACYVTTLENVYVDLAYSYAEGVLYGLNLYENADGYPYAKLYTINLKGAYFDEDLYQEFAPYEETDVGTQSGGIYALTMAIDDAGTVYVLGLEAEEEYDSETQETTITYSETAHLYKASFEEDWGWVHMAYGFTDVGDTGMKMDFMQSMTWDHNSETMYWARFYYNGKLSSELERELVKIDVTGLYDETGAFKNDGTFTCEVVGKLSKETCALFAPLTPATALTHTNVPEFDATVVGTPILNTESVTLSKGDSTTLTCAFDPWYSTYTDVVWSTSDDSVATVENGVVKAVGNGNCVITVASAQNESKFDTCTVSVASLSLSINGTITTSAGMNAVKDARLYNYSIVDGERIYTDGVHMTAVGEFEGYGMMIGAAVQGKNNELWVTEWGNSGMFYRIDPVTGNVVDMTFPIGGNHTFGMAYSEATGHYTTISNDNIFVDLNLPLSKKDIEEMLGGEVYEIDPDTDVIAVDETGEEPDDEKADGEKIFNWHRLDMLPYLRMSEGNFVTNENGNGAESEIVFCGITNIDNTYVPDFSSMYGPEYQYSLNGSVVNPDAYSYAMYTPDTTHVLLDNVGRLWYIDEICNMEYSEQYSAYLKTVDGFEDPMQIEPDGNKCGVMSMENRDGFYNVFVIRDIVETGLTDMFREGTMPRISYNFSDIYYAGETVVWQGLVEDPEQWDPETYEPLMVYTEYTAPVFYLSLYDHWNEGVTNELYLYIPSVQTGVWDDSIWGFMKTDELLMKLGDTGEGNIIATITSATPANEIVGLPFGNKEMTAVEASVMTVREPARSSVTHFSFIH